MLARELEPGEERLRENRTYTNRVAKRLLREAGEYPNPYWVYYPQLMWWALDSGELRPRPEWEDTLNLQMGYLLGADPAWANRFLSQETEEETQTADGWLDGMDPSEAAAAMLEQVADVLKSRRYPP